MKSIKHDSYSEWLVINSQLGDSQAFEALIQLWQERLFLYGMKKLGNREAAQDSLQDCLISINKGIGRLRDPAAFPKWAFLIMERRCQDQLRGIIKARNVQTELASEAGEHPDHTDAETNAVDNNMSINKFLSQLAPELSIPIRLYYLEEMSLRDIAEICDLPEGTVKSRLYYARKKLAELIEHTGEKNHE